MGYNAGVENFQIPYDRSFYDRANENKDSWSLNEAFTLTPEGDKPPMKTMGRAFDVDAGQVLRVSQPGERGNIVDVMFFNRHNLDERNDLSIQLTHEGFLMTKYTRIWSGLPYMRPLAVCVEDATDTSYLPPGYGHHEWIGHCTPEQIQIVEGRLNASSCHTNFLQAAQSRALGEEIARTPNANIFQPATYRANADGTQVMGYADVPLQTKQGDYIDFYAQMDLLILVSLCPCGDQTASWKDVWIMPMTVEVFNTGTTPPGFERFHNWRPHFKDMVAQPD
jgi:uncharacterized protein YcgI (DUF1989 family)